MKLARSWAVLLLFLAGTTTSAVGWTTLMPAAATINRHSDEKPTLTISTNRFGGFKITELDFTGANLKQVGDDAGDSQSAQWSPDGKRSIFASGRSGMQQIYAMNSDGTGVTNLTNTGTGEFQPSLSPDGKRIAFDSLRDGNHEIYVMDADGSNPVNITKDENWDADAAWSPDGKQILFVSNRTGAFRLWVTNPDGTDQHQLLDRDLHGWVYPSWSPDGKQVLFSDVAPDGNRQIFVVNADGKGVEQLTDGEGTNGFPAWSPDGRYIAYLHYAQRQDNSPDGAQLMLLDLEEGTRKQISPADTKCTGRPAWKPVKR